MRRERCGTLPDGRVVDRFILQAGDLRLSVITYGAAITSLLVADDEGQWDEVVLGFDGLAPYLVNAAYLGVVVGRYANRVADGAFSLDGVRHQLPLNDGRHHLHGGPGGFSRQLWAADASTDAGHCRVVLQRRSPDGEEGYPGQLDVAVTYELPGDGSVVMRYEATTDAPTIINLTQHSYLNLGGRASRDVLDHELCIQASRYTPVGPGLIPTGSVEPVADTPFDFTRPSTLRERLGMTHHQMAIAGGVDHNFVLDGELAAGVAGERLAATLCDPASGRTLRVSTTEPGLQVYDGHLLDGALESADGRRLVPYAGLCLETQHYPDSPNQPSFPSTRLDPGTRFSSTTRWQFIRG